MPQHKLIQKLNQLHYYYIQHIVRKTKHNIHQIFENRLDYVKKMLWTVTNILVSRPPIRAGMFVLWSHWFLQNQGKGNATLRHWHWPVESLISTDGHKKRERRQWQWQDKSQELSKSTYLLLRSKKEFALFNLCELYYTILYYCTAFTMQRAVHTYTEADSLTTQDSGLDWTRLDLELRPLPCNL